MIETRFKDTEIGLIPEDWEVKKLGDIGDVSMCKRVMKYQTTEKGDIPFYKIGTFGNKADAYITRELFDDLKQKYSYPQKGAILLSAAGTIGRTVVFDGNDSYFQDSNIVWIDNDESSVLNSYLYYCYKTMKWETENGGIVTRLYNDNLKSALLLVPNIQEQAVIASVLSDVDGLLRELGELIAKKKAIKMGMMQELLTVEAVPGKEGVFRPKRRLEGFEGDWKSYSFKELYKYASEGGTPDTSVSSYYQGGNIPFVKIEDTVNKYITSCKSFITEEGLAHSSAWMIPVNSVIFTNGATIGNVAINKIPVSTKQGILGIVPREIFDSEFLYYYLT